MTRGLEFNWVAQERESIPQPPSDYFAVIGSRGGNSTKAKRGKQHYAEMGRKAQANKAKRKYENTQDVSL